MSKKNTQSPLMVALMSLVVPGSGQWVLGRVSRAIILFISLLITGLLIIWSGLTVLFAPFIALWLWGVWDAYQLAKGNKIGIAMPVLLGVLIVYSLSASAVEFRPRRLATGWPAMQPFLRSLVRPELMEYPTEEIVGSVPILVPCISPLPAPDRTPTSHPTLTISAKCGSIDDVVQISGDGFVPDLEGVMWWVNPVGDRQRVLENSAIMHFTPDANGHFSAEIIIPLAVPISMVPDEGETQSHAISAEQGRPFGKLQPTETLKLVLEKIGETVALAFMATVLGVVFAVPVSFLAARNLMDGNRVTLAIYYFVRTILNVIRSIETLMWAIIFAVWVGLGPFGGTLALWLHTVAALGKLYSEAIESVDPGPIEALRATGARAPQIVTYAVLPQILPTFTSFTLYRWDINVRMSTVIGLVSDAGLGFLVIQWIRLNRFSSMATAIIAIVIVVAALDYFSSWMRKRIIDGVPRGQKPKPIRKALTRILVPVAFIAMFAWSWQVARIDPVGLVTGAPNGWRIIKSFAVPDLITRPTEEVAVEMTLPVPCESGPVATNSAETGQRVELSIQCGEVGDPLTITGFDLPPNADVSVRWTFSDGAFLRVKSHCCETDSDGNLTLETAIHPLLEVDPDSERNAPGGVIIRWENTVGGPQLSEAFKRVVDLVLVTILMALMATTLGAMMAIPLSFFAARNIMGESRLGRAVYNLLRAAFNLFRSVEPMILVLIAAAWVGSGPFAGMLALMFNNVPNLGKLFSETIEEIDNRPVNAITATGASRFQVLAFAIVPQLVPKFLAFILYQWDINIRMSTVIGFVGGGGIGQQFRLWVGLNQYAAAGTATWAIVLVVWLMDYLSAKAREKLV